MQCMGTRSQHACLPALTLACGKAFIDEERHVVFHRAGDSIISKAQVPKGASRAFGGWGPCLRAISGLALGVGPLAAQPREGACVPVLSQHVVLPHGVGPSDRIHCRAPGCRAGGHTGHGVHEHGLYGVWCTEVHCGAPMPGAVPGALPGGPLPLRPKCPPSQVPLHEWSHLAFEYDGELMAIYLNGHKAPRRLPSSPPLPSSSSSLVAAGGCGSLGKLYPRPYDSGAHRLSHTPCSLPSSLNWFPNPNPNDSSTLILAHFLAYLVQEPGSVRAGLESSSRDP